MSEATRSAHDGVAINVGGGNQTILPIGRAIHANTSGNIAFVMPSGVTLTIAVNAGSYYPYSVATVLQSGTTAAGAIMR